METIELQEKLHREELRYFLYFKNNGAINTIIRKIPGATFSGSNKAWHIAAKTENLSLLRNFIIGIATINVTGAHELPVASKELVNELNENKIMRVEAFRKWMRSKRYSESTIATYTDALRSFLKYFPFKEIHEISNEDLIDYNNGYILKNKLSSSYQNQVVNAVKLFYRTVELRTMHAELIHRPKTAKLLPNVLSKEEVKRILAAHGNIKHRVMLSLIYSCGLRCGELLKLRPENIDSKRGLILVKQSKGRKDRIVPLSPKILALLREYYIAYSPKNWLFEGQIAGQSYDERSLQQVLKQSLVKANISKPVTLHWLRHSYATHLLESGTDLRYIQELLGHSRSTTTEIYTHVSNKDIQRILSPFDSL